MGAVEGGGGGGGGGGVDLALGFKNFWDGVYNFFFCPQFFIIYPQIVLAYTRMAKHFHH